MYADDPAILRVPLSAYKSISLQIVDHHGHIAPAFQHLLADLSLREWTQMIQRLQDGKLRIGQIANRISLCQPRKHGIGATGRLDKCVEGAHLCA